VLEARSNTKFQLLLLFNIVGPFLGLTRNLGARHDTSKYNKIKLNLPRDSRHHFFYFPMDDCHFGYKQKNVKKTLNESLFFLFYGK
jgi:hypothetical protein